MPTNTQRGTFIYQRHDTAETFICARSNREKKAKQVRCADDRKRIVHLHIQSPTKTAGSPERVVLLKMPSLEEMASFWDISTTCAGLPKNQRNKKK